MYFAHSYSHHVAEPICNSGVYSYVETSAARSKVAKLGVIWIRDNAISKNMSLSCRRDQQDNEDQTADVADDVTDPGIMLKDFMSA